MPPESLSGRTLALSNHRKNERPGEDDTQDDEDIHDNEGYSDCRERVVGSGPEEF